MTASPSVEIRRTPQVVAASETLPGRARPSLVLRAQPGVNLASERARFRLAARAHGAVTGPHLPEVVLDGSDEAIPRLAFDSVAVADGERVATLLSSSDWPLPFEAAIGFVEAFAHTLTAAHETRDPETGAPCTFGVLGWGNFFFDPEGRFSMVGLGAPLTVGLAPFTPGTYAAPEMLAGGAPSPGADVFAGLSLQRSLLGSVDLPDVLRRLFRYVPRPSDARIAADFLKMNHRIFAGAPAKRPSAAECLDALWHAWRALGVRPDLRAFEQVIGELLRGEAARTKRVLRVGPRGEWFAWDGEDRVALTRRASLRRLLDAIAEEGRPVLSVEALLQAGWPGERVVGGSGAARVYVAVATLRKLGLRTAIERCDDGYRVSPAVRLLRE